MHATVLWPVYAADKECARIVHELLYHALSLPKLGTEVAVSCVTHGVHRQKSQGGRQASVTDLYGWVCVECSEFGKVMHLGITGPC